MDCEQWQHQLLLADSGELTDEARRDLDSHLAGCRACRDFRDASVTIADAVRPLLRRGEPAAATVAAINEEAVAKAGRACPLIFRPMVIQVAACAAAFILVAGGWFLLRPGESASPDAIQQTGSLLTMVSERHATDSGVPAASVSDDDSRLRALARELLRMEGLALD